MSLDKKSVLSSIFEVYESGTHLKTLQINASGVVVKIPNGTKEARPG